MKLYLLLDKFRFRMFFFPVVDEAVKSGIARVEKLLAQANDHDGTHQPMATQPPVPPTHANAAATTNTTSDSASEEKDLHDLSTVSSNQVT